jgi:beta-N-acetylhexosaminidase
MKRIAAALAAGIALAASTGAGGRSGASPTNAQLAGQRIIYAYAGRNPPAQLLARIRAGEAAGVIFFAPNIASPARLRDVIEELQKANGARPPLLMLIDQEGGLVRRLPGPPLLSEKQIGASSQAATLAAQAGASAAKNVLADGINVNLSPVLDVYRAPGNFIDRYQRSYSSSAPLAGTLGAAFIAASQRAGVAATAKHFPGLGAAATAQDTDTGPVTLDLPLSELRGVDEAPYGAAIAAGVKLVMVSWAVYPALDGTRPAGLSPVVVASELRGRLGFRGVVISDSLGAGALASYGGFAQRAVLAAQAGDDLILCAVTDPAHNSVGKGTAALQAIAGAIADGQLPLSAAQAAAARVRALRSGLAR